MIRLAASFILLAAFALPLYWPPAGAPLAVPAPDAGLLERLFPGLPGWWVVLRLLALFAGAALLPLQPLAFAAPSAAQPAHHAAAMRATLLVTLALIAASFFVDDFSRPLQLAYIAAFFLPAIAAVMLEEGGLRNAIENLLRRIRSTDGGVSRAILLVVVAWLLVRLPLTFHSPRIADALDMSLAYEALERAVDPALNLITGGIQAGGITALHVVPQGAGILGWTAIPLSVGMVQGIHLAWGALTGYLLGRMVARRLGAAAGAVATAALLFSPYILSTTYFLGAVFLGPLFTVALLYLYLRVRDRAALSALMMMAALAGIAATHPGLAPMAMALFGLALWTAWRAGRSALSLSVPALLFATIVLPSLPPARSVEQLFMSLAQSRTQWAAMEVGIFGQIATHLGDAVTRIGRAGLLDVPLGAILAPFAIPRTPMRLWGWNLFDPLATVLATIGIVVCARSARHSGMARGLLALLALAILPGFASTYDRPSLTRMFVLPVPMALLAAIGCEQLRRALPIRGREGATGFAMVLVIAAGGIWLFDVIHPRLLPHSATALAIDLVQRTQPHAPLMVRHPEWDIEEIELYAGQVPRQPIAVRPFAGTETFAGMDADVVLWSPALEQSLGVSAAICQRWPDATMAVIEDRTGQSKLFTARMAPSAVGDGTPLRVAASGACGMTLPTEAVSAAAAVAEADRLHADGRVDEALVLLKARAAELFVAVTLFDRLARLLMERGDLEQAEYWAWRASLPKSGDARPHLTLAEIQAARGQVDRALATAQWGRGVAERAGDSIMAAKAEELLQSLAARRGGA